MVFILEWGQLFIAKKYKSNADKMHEIMLRWLASGDIIWRHESRSMLGQLVATIADPVPWCHFLSPGAIELRNLDMDP